MIGELRDGDGGDLHALRGQLADALKALVTDEVEFVSVEIPARDLIRVELLLTADSWKGASDLGRETMAQTLRDVGVDLSSSEFAVASSGERHLEPVGTQLIPA